MAEDIIRRGAERLGRRLDWILLAIVGLLLVCAVLAQPGWSLLAGFWQIQISETGLITDPVATGGLGGALLNAALVLLLSILLPELYKSIRQLVGNLTTYYGTIEAWMLRLLENNPDLLVAVHPTRGLDIGATRFIHDTMIEARDRGCGVLLVSADFDEILEVSDRIVVMFEGQVMGVYPGKNPPIEEISLAMAGK